MGIHDRDYMRRGRKPKGAVKQVQENLSHANHWQTWAAVVVIILVIIAAVWPRKRSPYYEASDPFADVWSEYEVLDPVDVNEARLEDLLRVPAIDEEIARGILDKRPFTTIDDLLDVRGIGKVNLSIIRQHIYIDTD